MLINRRLLPLKGHMFLFFGCIAPILAFVLVLALQLGIPLPLQGTLTALCLLFTIVAKPLIAGLADAFPSYRKVLFLAVLGIMVTSFSAIKFIPPLEKSFQIRGRLLSDVSLLGNGSYNQENVTEKEDTIERSNGTMNSMKNHRLFQHGTESNASLHGLLFLLADNDGSNPDIRSGKECTFICESWYCSNVTETERKDEYLSISLVSWYTGQQVSNHSTKVSDQLYQIEGIQIPIRYQQVDVSLQCLGGEFVSEDGSYQRALQSWQFWLLAVFMIAGHSTFNTAVSITDAITVDTIDNDGSYGVQRAWGTIGWGVIAPISGLLVDWWSGNSSTKDYTPAFLLCFSLGALDLILSAAYLKVPKIKDDSNILEKIFGLF
ncbi:uncharacterized protein LOC135209591 [Macrobrachium nipponense]|uniref:uncharacterized protein LOC135209591 n=1 Tax=Macrobrachium nipponense TaxID=159736 RepID=UPI0030C825AD